jgi:protease II
MLLLIFAAEKILGRQWYDDGKLLKKKNTFTDFIDCSCYYAYYTQQNICMPKVDQQEDC